MYFVQVDYTMSYWLVFKLCVFISRDHYSVAAFPGILLLVGCYSYDGLFRHSTYLSGFFPGTPMEAIMDCYPYDSLLRHCVKYARFFPGTPMEAITDCYLHEAFSGIAHVHGVLSMFFSEDCQQIFTRFLYESTSYGFALT